MTTGEGIAVAGICSAIGAACIATHSIEPLWAIFLILLFLGG